MTITLNGQEYETLKALTVADLLEELGLTGQRVAVLLDEQIITRTRFAETPLAPQCRIEMIQMVGGG